MGKDVDASERTVVLKREMWHDRLSFLVWGGRNYLQDVKDSTYEQVHMLCQNPVEPKMVVILRTFVLMGCHVYVLCRDVKRSELRYARQRQRISWM